MALESDSSDEEDEKMRLSEKECRIYRPGTWPKLCEAGLPNE
jgi:hypothetical protein